MPLQLALKEFNADWTTEERSEVEWLNTQRDTQKP